MNGNFGRIKFWITANARAYTGERKRERAKLVGQPERINIARRQKLWLARSAPSPNGSSGMDDVLCHQAVTLCRFGLPRVAPTKQSARVHKFRSSGPVDGVVNTAAPKERAVGCVNDDVNRKSGDVGLGSKQFHSLNTHSVSPHALRTVSP